MNQSDNIGTVVWSDGKYYAIDGNDQVIYVFDLDATDVPDEYMNIARRIDRFYNSGVVDRRTDMRFGSYGCSCP